MAKLCCPPGAIVLKWPRVYLLLPVTYRMVTLQHKPFPHNCMRETEQLCHNVVIFSEVIFI